MGKTIRIKVGGIAYSVTSEDEEAYVTALAAELEHSMDVLARQKPFLSTTMVAVMTALDCLDQAKKTAAENTRLRLALKRYEEKEACRRMGKEDY